MRASRTGWFIVAAILVGVTAAWIQSQHRLTEFRARLEEAQAAYGRMHAVLAQERAESAARNSDSAVSQSPQRRQWTDCKVTPTCQPDDLDLTGERLDVLDEILRKVLAGSQTRLTAEERVIALMRYVANATALEQCVGSGSDVLVQRKGICGGMALALVALCRRDGIPARFTGLFNLPKIGGHAAAVVYFDDAWHYFDPTFGIFFHSADHYPAKGRIASLDELLVDPDSWTMFRVTSQPWKAVYNAAIAAQPIVPVEESYLRERFHFVLSEQYRTGLHAAFPIRGRPEQTVSYPLAVDLSGAQFVTLGGGNDSRRALWQAGHYELSPYGFHTLIVRGAKGQRVRIEYVVADGVMPELAPVPLAAARLLSSETYDDRFVATLDVNADEAIVAVFANTWVTLEMIEFSKDVGESAAPLHLPRQTPLAHWQRRGRRLHGSYAAQAENDVQTAQAAAPLRR